MNPIAIKAILGTLAGILASVGVMLTMLSTQMENPVEPGFALGQAGLATNVASTSNFAVSNIQKQVFATSSCTARVISTTGAAGGIMITFTDVRGITPTTTLGHYQAASTTVAYDSATYGCGSLRVFSWVAQNIVVSEMK